MTLQETLEQMDRQGLLDYIESLEAKTTALENQLDELKAQVDFLNLSEEDFGDFSVPVGTVPELKVSDQTASALAEAASLFGGEETVEEEPVTERPNKKPVRVNVRKAKKVSVKKKAKPVEPQKNPVEKDPFEDFLVEPAPVENGVVRLSPVREEESYIPVSPKKKP